MVVARAAVSTIKTAKQTFEIMPILPRFDGKLAPPLMRQPCRRQGHQ